MLNKLFGNEGEKIAENYLKKKKYRFVARNYQMKAGEIDLIMEDGTTLVFIEVKRRSSDKFGYGFEAVGKGKQRRIIIAAKHYCVVNKIEKLCRFDVVSIDGDRITHIENAFY